MAKRRRKTRTHLSGPENEASKSSSSAPKSFVIRSGKVSASVGNLVSEVRQVMEPNTASRLRERKSNKLRDFLTMCGPLGVSHMIIFSQKGARDAKTGREEAVGNINLRIARAPRGPTVTFRINKFALCRDVAKAQRRMRATGGEYNTAPLLVLNNFSSSEKHIKLLVSVFQGLFPPIHVQTMHLSQARRIVLLHYNEATGTIEWRHYLISVRPVGVSRRVRRVIEGSSGSRPALSTQAKKIPNLSSAKDISEYLLGSQNVSNQDGGFETDASSASEADSDVEEGGRASNHVQLPDSYIGRGNVRDSQRAVRLVELGPRMELRCVKIEEGIPGAGKDAKGTGSGGNDVLWHDYVKKSMAESSQQRKILLYREKERRRRREAQEENVRRKKEEAEALKSSKRGKQDVRKEAQEDNDGDDSQESEPSILVEGGEDEEEFAYEDQHASGHKDVLSEEDDALDEDNWVGEEIEGSDSQGESEDDSDLSPIDVDSNGGDGIDEGRSSRTLKRLKKHV